MPPLANDSQKWVNLVAQKKGYQLTNLAMGGTGYLYKKTSVETIKNAREIADVTDFSKCDLVTLAYGVNDWKYAVNIGSMADDIQTGGSMVANLRYVIKKILSDNPYYVLIVSQIKEFVNTLFTKKSHFGDKCICMEIFFQ